MSEPLPNTGYGVSNAALSEPATTVHKASSKTTDVDDAAIQLLQRWAGEQFGCVMQNMKAMQEQMSLMQQQQSAPAGSVLSGTSGDALDTVERLKVQIQDLTNQVKSLEAKNEQLVLENDQLRNANRNSLN